MWATRLHTEPCRFAETKETVRGSQMSACKSSQSVRFILQTNRGQHITRLLACPSPALALTAINQQSFQMKPCSVPASDLIPFSSRSNTNINSPYVFFELISLPPNVVSWREWAVVVPVTSRELQPSLRFVPFLDWLSSNGLTFPSTRFTRS